MKNYGVFDCPSAARKYTFGPANDRYNVTLGYSEFIFHNSGGWANMAVLSSVPAGPAGIAVVADSGYGPMFNDWSNADSGGRQCPGEHPQLGLYRIKYAVDPPWQNPLTCTRRHGSAGSNVVFADGHAKLIPFGRIQGGFQTPCQMPVVRADKPQCN